MLNPRKRITKRELKEDPLVTRYFMAVDYLNAHMKQITYWVLGIAVAAVLAYFLISSSREAEVQAASRVGQIEILYMRGQFKEASDEFLSIIQQYSDTDAAGLATFYLANCYFYQDQPDLAMDYYNKYISDYKTDPDLVASAHAGIGACLENQNKYQEAAAEYRKAIDSHKEGFAVPQYLLNIARCSNALDDKKEAQTIYQEIMANYPDSPFRDKAEALLAEL